MFAREVKWIYQGSFHRAVRSQVDLAAFCSKQSQKYDWVSSIEHQDEGIKPIVEGRAKCSWPYILQSIFFLNHYLLNLMLLNRLKQGRRLFFRVFLKCFLHTAKHAILVDFQSGNSNGLFDIILQCFLYLTKRS